MTMLDDPRARIQLLGDAVIDELNAHLDDEAAGLCVVKAPPGSGKTFTMIEAVAHAVRSGQRVAVAAQTNAQCDDFCRRIDAAHPSAAVLRLSGKQARPPQELPGPVRWSSDLTDAPTGPCVVVSTTAKWSLTTVDPAFDVLFVDEAWQMCWADFMLLGRVAGRFVLIGDPGQIPPTVTVPTERWETAPRAPHRAAPQLLLEDPAVPLRALELPACRRLPFDAVQMVRGFYDFDFATWALPGDRTLQPQHPAQHHDGIDHALDSLADRSGVVLTLPTPAGGPPLGHDTDVAQAVADTAQRVLDRSTVAAADDSGRLELVEPADIGICATHTRMNRAIRDAVSPDLVRAGLRVDTPERWQGLERKVMIVVHPLSGVVHPSSFDLETGRLCVMASRHRSALVVVSRDHVPATLDAHIPTADQAVGQPDLNGRGHSQHLRFWSSFATEGAIVPM